MIADPYARHKPIGGVEQERVQPSHPFAGHEPSSAELIVLAATKLEMAPLLTALDIDPGTLGGEWPTRTHAVIDGRPITFVVTGLGKANAAAALAAATADARQGGGSASTVLQVGIAGAYPGCDLPLGAVAVAASERDLDLGVGEDRDRAGLDAMGFELLPGSGVHNVIGLRSAAAERAATHLGAPLLDFATSDGVTATPAAAHLTAARHGVALESMEGFAAAQVALALGATFVEVRAVSNRVGERDKAAWRLREAVAAAAAAARAALAVL